MPLWLDALVMGAVDAAYARRRYPVPPAGRLAAARIVSHRGIRDGRRVIENTFAAFDPLRGSGVFGLELDVRWTADLVPVVFHDADLRRLFGDRARLAELPWRRLHAERPEIPDLHGFVRRYCGEFHLMVELKHEPYPDRALQDQRLREALAPALERDRCTVLSLVPAMFAWLPSLPAARTMGVARTNVAEVSAEALAAGRAGFSCHYATLPAACIDRHHGAGQRVGSGFPDSAAVLFRELGRGVDYLFTNRALALQRIVDEARASAQAAH
jgi:glycerophosphoryl diester phosphodiesterase